MITIINNNVTSTEGKYIQRKGMPFSEIHNCQALPGDTVDDWFEVDEIPFDEEAYKAKVKELIAQKYSIEDEIALINNLRLDKEEYVKEYEEYMAYRIKCKEEAKEQI